jgi:myo-inositol-1(or 4)-monophosphatase
MWVDELTDWLTMLTVASQRMSKEILGLYHTTEAGKGFGVGAGGDIKKKIDLASEKALIDTLNEYKTSCALVSEESGTQRIGTEPSKYVLTADPLDGTTNALRGLPFMATSLAVSQKPYLQEVETALVSDLIHNVTYTAQRGQGAFRNGEIIKPSKNVSLEDAVIGVDINTLKIKQLVNQMASLFEKTKHLRHFGANALELCYVADGSTDAFIDIRGKLRVTDIAAAQLILREAGGIIKSPEDKNLDAPLDAAQRISFVAAANKALYDTIQKLLKEH